MSDRCAALARRLVEADLDALLVTRMVNVRWLTGFTGSWGSCLVTADGGCALATDGRYEEQAASQAPACELIISRTRDWLPQRLGLTATLGVESQALPWDVALELGEALGRSRVLRAGGHVEALRQRKDDDELTLVRRACAVTSTAWAGLLGWLAPGTTEREAARRLRGEIEALGGDGLAFDTILASGPNSARPHHRPGERVLAAGDLVKVDFGAQVGGYCSDMTRVAALGAIDPALRRVYDVVRRAQEAGVAALADGVAAADVDAVCRSVITVEGFGERFVHGTGHGLGLEIHEQPILSHASRATLCNRMTVTVEPGVYLPGLGGVRIEDTVAVLSTGPEPLTTADRDLVVL